MAEDIEGVDGPQTEERQNFMQVLPMVQYGELVDSLTTKLKEVIDAVVENSKTGELTLKLKIKPTSLDKFSNRPQQIELTGEVTAKLPKGTASVSTLYLGKDNKLQARDPRQPEIPELMPQRRKQPIAESAMRASGE